MSDMSMPDTRAGATSRNTIRGLARSWWLFLILGVLWILFGMFVLVATVGVGTPVVLALVMGDRSHKLLDGIKDWMTANNAVIMAVLLLILGVKLIGDGIGGL